MDRDLKKKLSWAAGEGRRRLEWRRRGEGGKVVGGRFFVRRRRPSILVGEHQECK